MLIHFPFPIIKEQVLENGYISIIVNNIRGVVKKEGYINKRYKVYGIGVRYLKKMQGV